MGEITDKKLKVLWTEDEPGTEEVVDDYEAPVYT